jgi:glycosyltransferase involved in cell wall biosynthesis
MLRANRPRLSKPGSHEVCELPAVGESRAEPILRGMSYTKRDLLDKRGQFPHSSSPPSAPSRMGVSPPPDRRDALPERSIRPIESAMSASPDVSQSNDPPCAAAGSVLVLEPYYGGSHKMLIDGIERHLSLRFELLTLPPRKWKWRMRGAAVTFADRLSETRTPPAFDTVFCSSYLNLAEFLGLVRVRLGHPRTVVYFHENQLTYPVRDEKERDYHFGLTNITTALAADRVIFNSDYNRHSFLDAIPAFLGRMPDHRPEGVVERIEAKAVTLPPPIDLAEIDAIAPGKKSGPPVILWNHRWEYDKNPEEFFRIVGQLAREGREFRLSVLGESFDEVPPIFEEARTQFRDRIVRFGYESDRAEYLRALRQADIVVSTAHHEFFGIALLEATHAGCYPLVPDRLVYPEIFPEPLCYASTAQLHDRLVSAMRTIDTIRREDRTEIAACFGWDRLRSRYRDLLAPGLREIRNEGESEPHQTGSVIENV